MTDISPVLNYDDVKVCGVEVKYQGFCRVEKYTLQTRLFTGKWTAPYTREVITQRFAVAALPYDPILNKVILIEQFRPGALEYRDAHNGTPWLLEIVAGLMDKDYQETHEEVLRREMREEANLEVLDFIEIYNYLVSPGILTERVKLYCARVDANKAPRFCGLACEHEDIRVHVVSVEEALVAVRNGRINNSAAIIALQWLALNLVEVRQQFILNS